MTTPITVTADIKQHPEEITNTLTHIRNTFGHHNVTTGNNPLTGWTQLHINIPSPTHPQDQDQDLRNTIETVFRYLVYFEIDIYGISAARKPTE